MIKFGLFLMASMVSFYSWSSVYQLDGSYSSQVNQVKFLKADPGIGFAATNRGLYKTTDNGGSWINISNNLPRANVTTYPGSINSNSQAIISLATNNGNLIYVLVQPSSSERAVYSSTDGGKHWEKLNTPEPEPFGISYIRLLQNNDLVIFNGTCLYKKKFNESDFLSLSCPHSGYIGYVSDSLIYASSSTTNPLENFKRSEDGGVGWNYMGDIDNKYGTMEAIFKGNINESLMSFTDNYKNVLYYTSSKGGVWTEQRRTEDSKNYISTISDNAKYFGVRNGEIYSILNNMNIVKFVSYEKNIAINDIYTVSDGIWTATQRGLFYISSDKSNVINVDDFNTDTAMASSIYPTPTGIYSLFPYSGGILDAVSLDMVKKTTDNGTSWTKVNISDGFYQQNISRAFYYDNTQGDLYLYVISRNSSSKNAWYISHNEGGSWQKLKDTSLGCGSGSSIYVSLSKIYCNTNYEYLNGEDDIRHTLKVNGNDIHSIDFPSQNKLLAFSSDGIYLSQNDGETWSHKAVFCSQNSVKPGAIVIKYINDDEYIVIIPTDLLNQKCPSTNHKYTVNHVTTYNGHVNIKSSNFDCPGKSNCPDARFKIERNSKGDLYFTDGVHIYFSRDSGDSWGLVTSDDFVVKDLKVSADKTYFLSGGGKAYTDGLFEIK